ncbi:MAG: DNA-directed RNA polymerase subunit beta' [Planctomycetes bacterium]|nr:DNA-directed RNA polymerase subunit beta' [Planctomycetota bacterium]MBI3834469.1 DNA-directed RNA polymerase subunit beta' [Planctomycetota bacterium]
MLDNIYERINDYSCVKISLASPNDIRSWSFGEVKKPETINYRTYRPEKDGLFCERIFGPERDWECACGKFKGTKHKGIICDRCGVKVTHSRVRRKRMGHINLAAPVVHIWFFKSMPSRLGALLDVKTASLEKVVYFQDYLVVDPGDTPLKPKQLLTEEEYRTAREQYGKNFVAMMGAEAVKELLARLDLPRLSQELRDELIKTGSKQREKDLAKRLKIVEALRNSPNETAWMVLEVIPVIPPDLRPLVLLDSGNFATSDLNDLYRRIINRNSRLKKLVDLNAPEVIIQNEKRMLQQAVDALFDNGRCRRPVLGSSNRPLKSMTDMIKGKQGRFRENLLGKRVDYSARSVVVVGPELKLNQCGLPKKIALELYQPFIIRKLKERGLADTIKSAKKMLERRDQAIWDILEEVIYQHPVMLNRAPTLHRMGIQAFEPVLVEGNAIKIHPLVCKGFNADFDGDQMAVHLPLSIEAQVEAHVLMMATNNIFSPANGSPIMSPTQDVVLGAFYLTTDHVSLVKSDKETPKFADLNEALTAYHHHAIGVHDKIVVRIPRTRVVSNFKALPEPMPANGRVLTTVGRLIFNDILPSKMPFYNCALSQKGLGRVVADCHEMLGRSATIDLLDDIKETGFKHSTLAGLSFGVTDMRIPRAKHRIIEEAQKNVDQIHKAFEQGTLTRLERYNQVIDRWIHAREQVTAAMMKELQEDFRDANDNYKSEGDAGAKPYLNPIFLMTQSGARGSVDQIRQLAGMRALMAKPSGEIIETPIKANFREGLSVLEYFSSTHGARKGLADTALKTADSGYLTRKLADVAQNVIVCMQNCGTINGVTKAATYKGEEVEIALRENIIGRVARDPVRNPVDDQLVVAENQLITKEVATRIEELGVDKIRVRSPLTCEAASGVCALCYGMDMSTSRLVEEGLAVGIIGAQSIGEPGTQLTMRTFHTGGVAQKAALENVLKASQKGIVKYHDLNPVVVPTEGGESRTIVLKRNGELLILDDKGRELSRDRIPYGAVLLVKDGQNVNKRDSLCEWDPHMTPILAEVGGVVRFEDVADGETVRLEQEGGRAKFVVIEHKGEKHPKIMIEDKGGSVLDYHYLPAKARIEVQEGQVIRPGMELARQPRAMGVTQDITGGLPRVTEIFEARRPKEPAIMAEISGMIEIRPDKRRGKMTIVIRNDSGMEKEHHVPQDKHLLVHAGDFVEAGDPLVEGPLIPHDILRIKGEESLQNYLLAEVQAVYRSQNVNINDKHLEVIVAQMLRKVKVNNPGDSGFLPGEVVDRFRFRVENERLGKSLVISNAGDTKLTLGQIVTRSELHAANAEAEAIGGESAKGRKPKPATANTLLLGITKASLSSESFISAASFQETTKVLTEAALAGAIDDLRGLKENVILGHLIPAGTGYRLYQKIRLKLLAEPIQVPTEIPEETPLGGVTGGLTEPLEPAGAVAASLEAQNAEASANSVGDGMDVPEASIATSDSM